MPRNLLTPQALTMMDVIARTGSRTGPARLTAAGIEQLDAVTNRVKHAATGWEMQLTRRWLDRLSNPQTRLALLERHAGPRLLGF